MRPRLIFAIGAIAFSCLVTSVASAATVIPGYAVGGIDQTTEVGMTTYRDLDGNGSSEEVIKYYIPLSESKSGTYDVTPVGSSWWGTQYAGMQSDSSTAANPSGWLDMYLRFAPVEEAGPHFLRFFFEDLDLDGVNDPANFLEDITIYDADNNVLGYFNTGGDYASRDPLVPPYELGDYSVESTNDYQQITLYYVDVPDDTDFFVKLHFSADYERVYNTCRSWGWGHTSCSNYCNQYFDKIKNTPEYMRAEIEAWPPELVPVPAAMPLFLSGLAALGFVGGRRRKKKQSRDA